MSASFLSAAGVRTADATASCASTSVYAVLAQSMDPLVRALLVDHADPAHVDIAELFRALKLDGSRHEWHSRHGDAMRTVRAALDSDQCATLRAAVDGAQMELVDSVDGLLEYQLNLTADTFEALVGQRTVNTLHGIAQDCFHQLYRYGPMDGVTREAARDVGMCTSPALPEEPHEIFIRRYSPTTRPWFGFHFDRSSLTVNVALSADEDHTGGRLLALLEGRVQSFERAEGTATVHASTLLHAVSRMNSGSRYSLILFYREVCPHACHELVECSAATMALFYPQAEGSYHCDVCGDSAEALGYPLMWHCKEGCEYDVCDTCHDHSLADGIEYVSVH